MLFRNILTLASTAAITSAENVYLTVKSDNSEVNGKSLSYPHEGAGINYFFLGTSSPSALTYDSDKKTIVYNSNQYFSTENGFVALTVAGSNAEITFDDDNTLLVDGSSANFYACKNTGDSYSYSTTSYELMYYSSDVPDGCIGLTVVNSDSSASTTDLVSTTAQGNSTTFTTSSTSTETVCPTCTESTFEGMAVKYSPVGVFAAAAGAFVALL